MSMRAAGTSAVIQGPAAGTSRLTIASHGNMIHVGAMTGMGGVVEVLMTGRAGVTGRKMTGVTGVTSKMLGAGMSEVYMSAAGAARPALLRRVAVSAGPWLSLQRRGLTEQLDLCDLDGVRC